MRLLFILTIGLLISVAYSAFTVDGSALSTFSHFPATGLIALLAMVILPWLTDTLRLQIWLRFLGQQERFFNVFRLTLAGEMASAVTPAAIGGAGARLGWLITRGMAPGMASSVVLFSALEDSVFFVIALPLALLFSSAAHDGLSFNKVGEMLQQRGFFSGRGVSLVLLGIAVLYLGGWTAWKLLPGAYKSRLRKFISKIKHQVEVAKQTLQLMVTKGGWRFFANVGLSGLHWACRFSMLTVLLAGLHQHVDPFKFFASQWLVFMLMKLVPSPGGTGGAELAFLFFYRVLIPENLLGLLVGAWRVLTFTLPVGLATLLFLAFMRKHTFIDLKVIGLKKSAEIA